MILDLGFRIWDLKNEGDTFVEEEADETLFWLEVIKEMKIFQYSKLDALIKENDEILAIVVASIRTAKKTHNKKEAN